MCPHLSTHGRLEFAGKSYYMPERNKHTPRPTPSSAHGILINIFLADNTCNSNSYIGMYS